MFKTSRDTLVIVLSNESHSNIYKIPVGSLGGGVVCSSISDDINKTPLVYVCSSTFYIEQYSRTFDFFLKNTNITKTHFMTYKPLYFNRLRYVGKGFKLLLKKRKRFFNCIFGHSHIFWIKIQSILVKKTKKYKFFFVSQRKYLFLEMTYLLRKIKPINRYTLRGVRTYTHIWIKRKGRKSIATHF